MGEPVQCERRGKWIRGCRWEGRWEVGPAQPASFGWGISIPDQERLTLASKAKTYVRDVCVTCGRMVERTPSPAPRGEETA